MAGKDNGVQVITRNIYSKAALVHCSIHLVVNNGGDRACSQQTVFQVHCLSINTFCILSHQTAFFSALLEPATQERLFSPRMLHSGMTRPKT